MNQIVSRINASYKNRPYSPSFFEKLLRQALNHIKGEALFMEIQIPGKPPTTLKFGSSELTIVKMTVTDQKFFKNAILYGEIGFAESFILGYWHCEDLMAVLNWFVRNSHQTPTFASEKVKSVFVGTLTFFDKIRHLGNRNTVKNSRENIRRHYDLSNEFFSLMLDETMAYSSALFPRSNSSLKEGQLQKFQAICDKLELKPEHHVLEIGSGWGGFSIYLAQKYKCRVTTITISRQQFEYAKQKIEKLKLGHLIDIQLVDYRDIKGKYDRIVSIEMAEAIGFNFFDIYFKQIDRLLVKDGICVIQCITFPDPYYRRYLKKTDFIQKYIFPGSDLLSLGEIISSLNRTSELMIWDVSSMGLHYAKTLKMWRKNFTRKLGRIRQLNFDENFIRMWTYYLSYCQSGFENRYINVVQLQISRPLNQQLKNLQHNAASFNFTENSW